MVAAAAAAAAKSLQSCPTLCNPIDGNSPGSPVHTILQAGILEWVAISFSNKVTMLQLKKINIFNILGRQNMKSLDKNTRQAVLTEFSDFGK